MSKKLTQSAIKHDSNKIRLELLNKSGLEAVALVMAFGAQKYGVNDWKKGMAWSRLYGAILRHVTAHMDGESVDPESGLSHLAHAATNLMFLLEYEKKDLGTDDRFKS